MAEIGATVEIAFPLVGFDVVDIFVSLLADFDCRSGVLDSPPDACKVTVEVGDALTVTVVAPDQDWRRLSGYSRL